MKKTILLNLLVISAFSFMGCVTKSKYTKQVTMYKTLKKNFSTLQQEKESIQKTLMLKRARIKALKNEMEDLNTKITSLEAALTGMKGKHGKLLSKLNATQSEMEKIRKDRDEARKRSRTLANLKKQFEDMIKAGNLEIVNINGRLVIKLKAAILFSPGKVRVRSKGKKALKEIAQVLKKIHGRHFQVAGHTDNDPIKRSRYKDNWQLSALRSVNVLRVLKKAGVPGKMLSASGYAEFQPLIKNITSENKKFNRRIEIQIIPEIPTSIGK
jgi:chemotaxis protein MotB